VAGLHMALFPAGAGGAALAYLTAAGTGVLTGLVAGKPIWAANAKIEAGLKAFFGALLGAGLMFVLRQWVHFAPDLPMLVPGEAADLVKVAEVGSLPAVALPLVAALLGGFFELDNTGAKDEGDAKAGGGAGGTKKRVADAKTNGQGKARVAEADQDDDDEGAAAPAPKRAKR